MDRTAVRRDVIKIGFARADLYDIIEGMKQGYPVDRDYLFNKIGDYRKCIESIRCDHPSEHSLQRTADTVQQYCDQVETALKRKRAS